MSDSNTISPRWYGLPQPGGGLPEPSDASTAARLADRARSRFAFSVRAVPTSLIGPVGVARGRITGVLYPAERRLIAVDIAVGTDHASTRKDIQRARRRLQAVRPGAPLTIDLDDAPDLHTLTGHAAPLVDSPDPSAAVCVRDDVEVRRVVLVAGPYRQPRTRWPGTIVMSLKNWCTITSEGASDPEELWAFIDELAELPCLDRVEVIDLMTLWSVFQRDGLFYDPFRPADPYVPDPRDRWEVRAAADGHEEVLRGVGLPGLREWPYASAIQNGLITVGSLRPYESVLVSTHPPVVLAVGADAVDDIEWTQLLAESMLDGLRRLEQSTDPTGQNGWQAWTKAMHGHPVRVHFHPLPAERADGLTLVMVNGRMAVFGYTPAGGVSLSPERLHEAIGDALWCLLLAYLAPPPPTGPEQVVVSADDTAMRDPAAAAAAAAFRTAWNALSPAATFARVEGPQFPAPQGPPARLTDRGHARAQREVSHIAWSLMTESSSVRGDVDHVRDTVLLPAALAAIRERLARLGQVDALHVAAVHVERLWAGHGRDYRDRTMRLVVGWDPLPSADDASP